MFIFKSIDIANLYDGDDEDEEDSKVIDLEFAIMECLKQVVSEVKTIFIATKTPINPEHMFAQMGLFLGIMTVNFLGDDKAKAIKKELSDMIYSQADYAQKRCADYGLHDKTKMTQQGGVQALRESEGSSIVVQAVRCYRYTYDACMDIVGCASLTNKNADVLKIMEMIPIYIKLSDDTHQSLSSFFSTPDLAFYLIKYTAIQIGWMIGLFVDRNKKKSIDVAEYCCGSVDTMIDFGEKFFVFSSKDRCHYDQYI